MGSISGIVSDLKFGRSTLLKAIEGLSERELTETPIYGEWKIKDVLAHVIGWDRRVIAILPLILHDRTSQVSSVEVQEHNRQSVSVWQDKSFAEVLAAIRSTHQQILDIVSALDHVEIDKRRERNSRIITIRSYVLDIMLEHERQHALEIEQWRKQLEKAIDPAAIRAMVRQTRADFIAILDCFNEDDVLDQTAVGVWSVNDVVGHLADWEQLALRAAYHIYDPSQPPITRLSDDIEAWNKIMAAERRVKSWPENYHYLRQTHLAMDEFIAALKPGDWRLRGSYPWFDEGTLAELLIQAAEHYPDHLPDLEQWYKKRYE
jgi:hypothetical protein